MVSLVIFNYKVEKELTVYISSILESKPKTEFEIIVVDNNEHNRLKTILKKSFLNSSASKNITYLGSKLYEKIKIIINNEKLSREMEKNARENILQNWTWDKSVERFLKIVKYEKRY